VAGKIILRKDPVISMNRFDWPLTGLEKFAATTNQLFLLIAAVRVALKAFAQFSHSFFSRTMLR
jgi:hypothetical protein